MVMSGFTRNFKPLNLLTAEQVEKITWGTLDILEHTGVRFESDRALDLFAKAGCAVDRDLMRVRFPPALVEESLGHCPSSFHVKARDAKHHLRIGGNTVYFSNSEGMRAVDLDSWEARPATRKENADGLRILDALENVHFLATYTPYFEVEGIPSVMAIPESVAGKIRHSTKFQETGYQLGCEVFTIRMAQAVGIEIMGGCNPSSPLAYYGDAVECAFRFCEAGFPLHLASGVVMGGTGPATVAGALMSTNAELMAGVVLIQLIKPGTRLTVADCAYPMNMRTGSPAFGAIGVSLHHAAFNQLWRSYGVPVHNSCGFSSSKIIDFQCGYEKAIMAVIAALSGCHIVFLPGGIHAELLYHPVQSILDNDIAGMVGRFIEGVHVTEETLALDLIEQVGPIPGMFLDKGHTREWWMQEQYVPKAADWLTYPEWIASGKKSALSYAADRMEDILATHEPVPLTAEQDRDLDRILEEARQYYEKQGML